MSPLIESIKCYFAGGLKWEQGAEPPSPLTLSTGAKGDGVGANNWRYKTCKAPVNLMIHNNQHITKLLHHHHRRRYQHQSIYMSNITGESKKTRQCTFQIPTFSKYFHW